MATLDPLAELVRLENENQTYRRELQRLYDREVELLENGFRLSAGVLAALYFLTEGEDGFDVQGLVNDLGALIAPDVPLAAPLSPSPFFAPLQAKYDAVAAMNAAENEAVQA